MPRRFGESPETVQRDLGALQSPDAVKPDPRVKQPHFLKHERTTMATLNFFCLCIDHLSNRYGDRLCDAAGLNFINLKLQEIEEAYQKMPEHCGGGTATTEAKYEATPKEPHRTDAAGH